MNWLLCLVLAFTTSAHAARHRKKAAAPKPVGGLNKLTKTATCNKTDSPKKVYIVKQWHLGPKTITRTFKEKYPQERNQTAIYQALTGEVKSKRVQLLVAEGCEKSEMNSKFETAWNGWDYADLHKVAQTKGYEKILTNVALKVEARFDDDILTMCGDDDKMIQEGNLRISNMRGWLGFWTRLQEKYIDDRGKMYGDAAADLLKLPHDTPAPKLLEKIRGQLKEDIGAFRTSLEARNESFVKTLNANEFTQAVVVIGGLHADDLKNKVQAAGLNCEVLEPPGYQREDEGLIAEFEKAIK